MNEARVKDANQPSGWLVALAVGIILSVVFGMLKLAEPYNQLKIRGVIHGEQVYGSNADSQTGVQVEFENSKFFYTGSVYVTTSGGDKFWLTTSAPFSTLMSDYESQRGVVEFYLFESNSLRQVVSVSIQDLRKVERMTIGRPCVKGGWMSYDGDWNKVQLVCFDPTIPSRCRFLCEEETR